MKLKTLLLCGITVFVTSACAVNPSSSSSEEINDRTINGKLKNVLDVFGNSNNVILLNDYKNLNIQQTVTTVNELGEKITNTHKLNLNGEINTNINGMLTYDAAKVKISSAFNNLNVALSTDIFGDEKTTSGEDINGNFYLLNKTAYLNFDDNAEQFVKNLINTFTGGMGALSPDLTNKIYIENALTNSMLPLSPSLKKIYSYIDSYTANLELFTNCIELSIQGDDISFSFDLGFNDIANLLYYTEENKNKDKQKFIDELSNQLVVNSFTGYITTDFEKDIILLDTNLDFVVNDISEGTTNNIHVIKNGTDQIEMKYVDAIIPSDLDTYINIFGE